MGMKTLTSKQFPYTGPYTLASGSGKSKGPTAEALKRAMSRLGKLPWRDFDQHYNRELEAALDSWDPGGQNGYGDGRWKKIRAAVVPAGLEHAGERALDFYAITLVQNEAGATSGMDGDAIVQHYITEFWKVAIANKGKWHYDNTHRPVRLGVDPANGGYSDCSGMVIQAHDYARRMSGLQVADPAKMNWSGYGNTDLHEDDWPKVASPFRVGDLGHFFNERHVIECITPGSVATAVWGSNGTEAAPDSFTLLQYPRFPEEFLFVVRPDLVL